MADLYTGVCGTETDGAIELVDYYGVYHHARRCDHWCQENTITLLEIHAQFDICYISLSLQSFVTSQSGAK